MFSLEYPETVFTVTSVILTFPNEVSADYRNKNYEHHGADCYNNVCLGAKF